MKHMIRKFVAVALLLIAVSGVDVSGQDRVALDRQIRFQRGSISATVRGRIARGTTHIYRVRARAGQEMAVYLRTGNRTSLTISGWESGVLEGADGVRQTIVELPETGEYVIQIGTDANAAYALEVTIN